MAHEVPFIGKNSRFPAILSDNEMPVLECPFCGVLTMPNLIGIFPPDPSGRTLFAAKFPCCGRYSTISAEGSSLLTNWKVEGLHMPRKKALPEIINKISPSFTVIYNEAMAAKELGLLEISGGGFRKALEYLIYDYAIYKNPDEAEAIKKVGQIANVAKTYISDEELRGHLTAAAWLGNDEIHYVRKHTELDICELVYFVDDVYRKIELLEKLEEKRRLLPDMEKRV